MERVIFSSLELERVDLLCDITVIPIENRLTFNLISLSDDSIVVTAPTIEERNKWVEIVTQNSESKMSEEERQKWKQKLN